MSVLRSRGFSIVIHNVFEKEQPYWERVIQGLKYDETVVSVEEYPESPGQYHCHIFTNHKNPCSKVKLLNYLQQNQTGHIDERIPAPEGKKLGRIQVDPRRGTMQESTAYLTQELTHKDKNCGVPKAFNKKHVQCLCGYRNYSTYMVEDYGDRNALCYKCWYEDSRRRRWFITDFDERLATYLRVCILWGSPQP